MATDLQLMVQEKTKSLPPALMQKTILIPLMIDLAARGNKTKLILYENFYRRAQAGNDLSILVLREGTPIKQLCQAMGMLPIIGIVAAMIDGYCQQFNVSKNMTSRQIEDLAIDLTTMFNERAGNSVMLEELAIFFDRAGKGMYCDKNGKPIVPFDRIDRALIESMMDIYFETDRTQAMWAIEDERNNNRKPIDSGTEFRLSQEGGNAGAETIGDIYTKMAGDPGKIPLAKMIQEANKKYRSDAT